MIDVAELKVVTDFQNVPTEECAWFAQHCEARTLDKGNTFFEQGQRVTILAILLSGTMNVVRRENGKEVASFLWEVGELSGLLPFSRMTSFGATTYATEPCRIATFSAELFPKLHEHAPEILQRLVNEMVDRTREFTQMGAQREKLLSLGTMSAGLAHELNNPASAAKRAAQNLKDTLQSFDEHSSNILIPVIFKEAHQDDPFSPVYAAMSLDGDRLGSLERSDLEDDLADYLEELGVANAWDASATLVAGGLSKEVLEEVAQQLKPEQVKNFLEWVPQDVEMRLLAKELIESTARISDLVGAMKAYSYMDRDGEKQATDLHEGIINTLMILKHRFKKKSVTLVKEFGDLPKVPVYGSELNQVWTNLLANAVDAVSEGGTITIRTAVDAPAEVACVDIIDNGPGIPEDIQDRIFEPFFTTKGVGEGTGMGLDISNRIVRQRHRGTVQLQSEPGQTRFRVRLPLTTED